MDFPIDTNGLRAILTSSRPAPAYDADNNRLPGQQAITNDGQPVWNNQLVISDGNRSVDVVVKTAGPKPPVVMLLSPVSVDGLVIRLFGQRNERHSLWATDIAPLA